MDSFSNVIDLWPSASALGRDLKINPSTIRAWKARDRIDGKYFGEIQRAAAKRRLKVDVALLCKLAADKPKLKAKRAQKRKRPTSGAA